MATRVAPSASRCGPAMALRRPRPPPTRIQPAQCAASTAGPCQWPTAPLGLMRASAARRLKHASFVHGLYGRSNGAVATRPVGTVGVLAARVAKPSTTCSDERSQRSAEHVAALDRDGVCKLLTGQWWVVKPCHPPRTFPSGCGECN